nr:hypothetical protein Iba_chr05cCG16370 [Ipomoea batatas]
MRNSSVLMKLIPNQEIRVRGVLKKRTNENFALYLALDISQSHNVKGSIITKKDHTYPRWRVGCETVDQTVCFALENLEKGHREGYNRDVE